MKAAPATARAKMATIALWVCRAIGTAPERHILYAFANCVVNQVVSYRHATANVWLRSQTSPCATFVEKLAVGLGTWFTPVRIMLPRPRR